MPKRIIFLALLILAFNCSANQEAEKWCTTKFNILKQYVAMPLDDLKKLKDSLEEIKSVKGMSVLLQGDFVQIIKMTQEHQEISYEEAEEKTLNFFKAMELKNIERAIYMYSMKSEDDWANAFQSCVKANG
ncbi:hypothetical protein [Pseudoalteromonas sp. G4]|uniref:hypothetical protein n=1 Tax=Pseudoalteromonas sp. G4 TaxID=2992761 RepID=UPI00237D9710|nr:hypothetical protein [Pseudoalteromonas sp. G4]MDE3271887.1 hypothetical protein [Pseudoalteromonas sp. G4]